MIVQSIACMLLLAAAAPADEAEIERDVTVTKKLGKTRVRIDIQADEIVFCAKLHGLESKAYPLRGVLFSEETEDVGINYLVLLETPEDAADGKWHVGFGTIAEDGSYLTVGCIDDTEDNEEATPNTPVAIPVKTEGVEVYCVPYRKVGERIDALLVVISKDKEKIKKAVNLEATRQFDWEKSFRPAYVPESLRRKPEEEASKPQA